jgi:hypothetical protein
MTQVRKVPKVFSRDAEPLTKPKATPKARPDVLDAAQMSELDMLRREVEALRTELGKKGVKRRRDALDVLADEAFTALGWDPRITRYYKSGARELLELKADDMFSKVNNATVYEVGNARLKHIGSFGDNNKTLLRIVEVL